MLLGEGEDSPVRRGVQDKGDKVCRFPGKCSLDVGEEDRVRREEGTAVLQHAGQRRGEGTAGGGDEVLQVPLLGGAGGEAPGSSLSRSPVAALPVSPVAAGQHPCLDCGGADKEEPQVSQKGWGPRPRGRKGAGRWQRLGKEAALAASSLY